MYWDQECCSFFLSLYTQAPHQLRCWAVLSSSISPEVTELWCWNTFPTLLNLPIRTHTYLGSQKRLAPAVRDSPSPEEPLFKLRGPRASQAFPWALSQRGVGLCVIMQGGNCGSTSFPSPNAQEFPAAPLWVCAWLVTMGIAIHHSVRGLKLSQRNLSVNQRLMESNLISTRHVLAAKKP